MTELQLPNYLGIVNQGREIGERRGLAQMFGQAMSGSREQRPSLLAKMAGTDPATAMTAQKHFDANDETARERLGQYAAAFDALPDEQKPMAYPQLAKQAQELGIPAPGEWNPAFAPNITKLAQSLRGGNGYQVQSTKVGADGFIYTIGRDGSFQNTGIKADPNTQIIEGAGGFYGVDKRNMQAAPVSIGQPGMQQAPQPQAPMQAQRAPGEVPFTIDPSLPPEVQASIRADEGKWASAPDGANMPVANRQGQMPGQGGGQLQGKGPSPLQVQAAQRAEEAAQRAAQAQRDAALARARGNAPAGQRFREDGTLEDIPGARLPAGSGGTEDEKKSAGYAVRMEDGLAVIAGIEKRNKDANRPGWGQAAIDMLPDAVGNALKSDDRQIIEAAQLDALDAALTLATGAAYTKEQLRGLSKAYFPQPNDSEAAILDKQRRLAKVVETARIRAGRAAPSIDALSPNNGRSPQGDTPRSNSVNSGSSQKFGGFRILED